MCSQPERFKFLGSVPGCSASIPDGFPPLQGYSERLDSSNFSSRRQGKLQENYKFIGRCNQGSTLLDPRPCTSKWQGDYSSKSRFSNFLRCFKDRMGSSSTTNQHRRTLERARSLGPYKLLGAESSISGSQNFSATDKGESCPVWPGQLLGNSIHQPVGRYKISTPHCIGSRHMVLRSRQEHGDISNSCSREMELHSRWKVQNLSRFDRMDARSQSVQTGNQTSGTPSGGSVCLSGKSSDARVCVMEARTRGNSNRCFQYPMGLSTELPVSSVLPDTNVPKKSNAGAGRLHSHCSSMEEPALVSSTPIHAHRTSSTIASGSENPEAPRDRQHSPSLLPEEVLVSCMENFQESLQSKGFLEKVSKILLSSWRGSTAKQYESAWKGWSSWCSNEKINPFSATIRHILSYLADLFHQGRQYPTIEVHRSAISSFHIPLKGVVVGWHPLVTKFMKGIFSLRPPKPRYFVTWDVNHVLQLLRSWSPAKSSSLKKLSLKLAMLGALITASRSSSLAKLDLKFRFFVSNGVYFKIADLTKCSRPERPGQKIFFASFPPDRRLCFCTYLKVYIERTKASHPTNSGAKNPLFLSYIKPHGPVTSTTLARWVKSTLAEAGIDTTKFKAHSSRSASSSAAYEAGVTLPDIMEAADWSTVSTFTKFYHRPVCKSSFVNAVLGQTEQRSLAVSSEE